MARKRRWVLDSEKEEVWRMWKSGAPLRAICSIPLVFVHLGGLFPSPPLCRRDVS
jgi:hypothetical protein